MKFHKPAPAKTPQWLKTLRQLIDERGLNPRQLSLQAGLNPTAVRDMLSGRVRHPRYDTLQALARTLGTSPAFLMGDSAIQQDINKGKIQPPEKLELLTEIIARIQETAEEMRRVLSPRELAVMATTIYRQMLDDERPHAPAAVLTSQAKTLIAYAQNSGGIKTKRT